MSCVLITGATGALGSELVPLFLADEDWQVRLILRARGEEHLRQRLEELWAYWKPGNCGASWRRRLEVVAGDACRPKLGLEESAFQRLAGEVTHVIHCAGKVKLNQSAEEAHGNAVDSARQIVDFSRACRQLCKLDVVSTIGVAGKWGGLVPERPLSEHREFHNTYEAAKAAAEEFLLAELEAGLPLTLHRPSMVVGHSQTGRIIHFQVFYYLCDLLSGRKTCGIVVDTGEARLDIIPVDYAARAIHLASQHPETVGRIFHLCSGPSRALHLGRLSDRLLAFAASRQEPSFRLRKIPLSLFKGALPVVRCFSWGRIRRALASLPWFLTYLEQATAFDVTETARYLSAHALSVPDVDDYLFRILTYYRENGAAR